MNKQRGFMDPDPEFVVLFVMAALIALIIGGAYVADAATCRQRANMMRLQSDYGVLQGCMVNAGDRWAPIEYIRIIDDKVQIVGGGE